MTARACAWRSGPDRNRSFSAPSFLFDQIRHHDFRCGRQVTGGSLSSLLDDFLNAIHRSLDFAYAGSIVPLFATPGADPKDLSDFFWQHHLGNYWTYLQEQYG